MPRDSVIDLQERLNRESAWRKKEIVYFRAIARQSSRDRFYFFRAGQVMLCAHWEGYLRRSIELYLEHAFAQNLRVRDLKPPFVALAYFQDVRKAAEAKFPGSAEHHLRLAEKILLGIDCVCAGSTWRVTTEANPGTETVEQLLLSAGLDPHLGTDAARWATWRVFIDEQIVRDRHRIAHGEGFRIDQVEFLARADRILELLDLLTALVLTAAQSKAYKAP